MLVVGLLLLLAAPVLAAPVKAQSVFIDF